MSNSYCHPGKAGGLPTGFTIVVGVTPPPTVNGVAQEPFDGVSMAYSFRDASATGKKQQQYFELMGSRGIYADGWMASVFGPRKPWVASQAELLSWSGKLAYLTKQPWIGHTFGWMKWKPENDVWSLYELKSDFSQAKDVAQQHPEKLAELRKKFEADAEANYVNPIGGSFNRAIIPRPVTQNEWHYKATDSRLPEQSLPNIKSHDNIITVDADFPAKANGVLFSMGSLAGGITLFVKDGVLVYEYNFYGFDRTIVRAPQPLPAGRASVSVALKMGYGILSVPASVSMAINGKEVASGKVPVTANRYFTSTGTLDIGADLGTGVSLQYYDQAPFAFNGTIRDVAVYYK